jgi:hypothetical protein
MQQLSSNIELGTASYRITILSIPKSMYGNGPGLMCKALQSCFAGDVLVTQCIWNFNRRDGKAKITAIIDTFANASTADAVQDKPYTGDLPWEE